MGSTAIEFNALQPLNASLPMLVTLSGIVTLVNPLQPLNAFTLMFLTPEGIVTFVNLSR